MKVRKVIANAKQRGHIRYDATGAKWVWGKGGQMICNKMPKKSPEDSLVTYFVTEEGGEVFKILSAMGTPKDTQNQQMRVRQTKKAEGAKKQEKKKVEAKKEADTDLNLDALESLGGTKKGGLAPALAEELNDETNT